MKGIDMKKGSIIIIAIAMLILLGAGYVILHKSNKSMVTNSTASNSSTSASANAVLVTKTSSSIGQYLAEPDGQALYTYGSDHSGVSNCSGSCLANWPAYQVKGSTANLPAGVGTIKRTDNGEMQYTYNGMPLYTFVGDSNGQVTGNGISNFSVAKPVTPSSTSSQSTSTAPASDTSNNSSSSYNW